MNDRQRTLAVLNYQPYDRMPVVHFGFWWELLQKWVTEGHLKDEEIQGWEDGNPADAVIGAKLGFDFNYFSVFGPNTSYDPGFTSEVVRELPDGSKHILNWHGVIQLHRPDTDGIPAEIDHLFKGRKEWEEFYKPRLQFSPERITNELVRVNEQSVPFGDGGRDFLRGDTREYPYGLYCGSLYGFIRNFIGVENLCYLAVDDEDLLTEVIDTIGDLAYQCVEAALKTGAKFDFGHFWEDICYKNGPLVNPAMFAEKVGPHYRRITELLHRYGINIVSLDCDGLIDALIPTWLENGVNTMFPIEVGTWNANIAPWREQYGKELRGVGGMNKVIFAFDKAAVDAEIERLRPLVDLGGFIPCPDHRIPSDAKFELVCYYSERMHQIYG